MIAADTAEPATGRSPRTSAASPTSAVSASPTRSSARASETLLLLPPWAIVHSRFWKLQVPYLARHFRVVTFDPRGNGRSDRPESAEEYGPRVTAQDALAVLDAAGVADAACSSATARPRAPRCCSPSSTPSACAARSSCRPRCRSRPPLPERTGHSFDAVLPEYEGWAKTNRHYWAQDFRGYLEFFFDRCFTEPHSTQADRGLGRAGRSRRRRRRWRSRSRRPDLDRADDRRPDGAACRARCSSPRATRDRADPRRPRRGLRRGRPAPSSSSSTASGTARTRATRCAFNRAAARLRRARLRAARPAPRRGAARSRRPQARAVRLLADRPRPRLARRRDRARAARAAPRPRDRLARAGPGHARARGAAASAIHPASALLANESRHIAAESREHELNVFQAWRRMDEILLANFMVFHDVAARRALRPLDRRRGVGARLLPAREPRAQDRRLRLPDRLRRLAADARGRRPTRRG